MCIRDSVTGGNLITGGVVEWIPSTNRVITLGTPVAKVAKSAKAIKAQSANTSHALSMKEDRPIVCSGTNPQNRGTWSFANNSSAGKVVLGSRVCYYNDPYLNSYNPVTMINGVDSGDYSYGLVPTDVAN